MTRNIQSNPQVPGPLSLSSVGEVVGSRGRGALRRLLFGSTSPIWRDPRVAPSSLYREAHSRDPPTLSERPGFGVPRQLRDAWIARGVSYAVFLPV
jgi:hypothetical protein